MSLVEDDSVAARSPSDSWRKGAPAATRKTTVVTNAMLTTCERIGMDGTGRIARDSVGRDRWHEFAGI
jgi:hypothetical protein